MVGTVVESRAIPWQLTSAGTNITIGKIPCHTYNHTPRAADEKLDGRAVLHFKGKARKFMQGYAEKLGIGWFQ